MSDQPTALRLASVLQNMGHKDVRLEAAGYELRRLYDVLGKSQALNRIREARIKELEEQLETQNEELQRLKIERNQLRAANAAWQQQVGGQS